MAKCRTEKTISVIIPVYNTEQFLKKCIQSVIRQTYGSLEIILVDDGSEDNSGAICNAFAEKDKRIRVLHKQNGGLSSARNAGLDAATGAYIGFVDSDDWIEADMYQTLVSVMEEQECSIVECGVNLCRNQKRRLFQETQNMEIISGKEALYRQMNMKQDFDIPRIAVWSKLFRREFWDENRFPEGKIHEDYMLTCKAFYEAGKAGLVYKGMYNHLVSNQDSIMNSRFGVKDLYLEQQYLDRYKYLRKQGDEKLEACALRNYYKLLLSLYWRCAENGMSEQKHYSRLLMQKKQEIKQMKMPPGKALEFEFFYFSPCLYRIVRKAWNRFRKRRIW